MAPGTIDDQMFSGDRVASPGVAISGSVPNAFDWLIPERLGVCVNPSVGQQAARMLEAGRVEVIVNLYEKADDAPILLRKTNW